jgi:hypothetical protein
MKEGKAEKKRAASSAVVQRTLPPKEPRTTQRSQRQIFCDLDGVLVDFERGVVELMGKKPSQINPKAMWAAIGKRSHFYRDLEWTADGNELWEAIRHLRPNILTGVPNVRGASRDKFEWCKRELCVEVAWCDMAAQGKKHVPVAIPASCVQSSNAVCTVITCWSVHKHKECKSKEHYDECEIGDILIDDRPEKLRDAWEQKGGFFVHHTSTAETLRILRQEGILLAHDPEPLQEADANTVNIPLNKNSRGEKSTTATPDSKPAKVETSVDRESKQSLETFQTDSTSATNTCACLSDPVANSKLRSFASR